MRILAAIGIVFALLLISTVVLLGMLGPPKLGSLREPRMAAYRLVGRRSRGGELPLNLAI
jgi:hypothetical protein